MAEKRISTEEVARRGDALYEHKIRQSVESGNSGKFLVLDVETGDYEVDSDEVAALQRMMKRNPDGSRYIKRIGFATAHRLGGSLSAGVRAR